MQKLSFSLVALVVLAITLTASALTTVSIDPVTVTSPEIGQQLEIQVKISGGRSIAGYQLTLIYDQTALAYVNIKVGDYLPEEKHEFPLVEDSPGLVMVWAVAINGVARKTDGTLALATFKVLAKKDSIIQLSEVKLSNREAKGIPATIQNGNVLGDEGLVEPLDLEATEAPLETGNLDNADLKPLDLANAAVVSVEPAEIGLPEVGQQVRIKIKIADGREVAGYQLTLAYDKTVLEYIDIKNGDYLPEDFAKVFEVEPAVSPGSVLYSALSLYGNVAKVANGTLATATFKVLSRKDSAIRLSNVLLSNGKAQQIAVTTQGSQITDKVAPRKPVITQRADGGKSLNISAVITAGGEPVTALTSIYQDQAGIIAEAGTLIEYQVKFSRLSVLKSGGVYVHTADAVLGTTAVVQGMRHQEETASGWSHQQIALDPIASKKIVAITIGTKVESAPKGLFSMLVDNIQLTDGDTIIKPIWLSVDRATEAVNGKIYGKLMGVDRLNLGIANDEVAVYPQGKVLTSWGQVKSHR